MSATPTSKCTICKSPTGLKCAGCQDASYCSEECQRTDWASHKLLCKTFKDFKIPPEQMMRRAIFFPVDDTKPKFIWVKISKCEEIGEETVLGLDKVIGGCDGLLHMGVNPVRNVHFRGEHIEAFHLESFYEPGTFRNASIHKVVEDCKRWWGVPLEQTEFPWCGNVLCMVVFDDERGTESSNDDSEEYEGSGGSEKSNDGSTMCFEGSEDPVNVYRDITTSDFRNIVDHLSIIPTAVLASRQWARKLKGVRVQGTSTKDLKFTAVTYPQDHPFTMNDRADSDDKIVGMTLKTYEMPRGKANNPPPAVATAIQVNIEIDFIAKALLPNPPTVENLDWIDTHFVREDGKDLLPEHMKVLVILIMQQYVMAMDALHGDSLILSDNNLLGKQAFEVTWNKCKEKDGWANDLPSPYEV